MLDVELIRKEPERVREGLRKKGRDGSLVDKFLSIDEEWRAKTLAVETLKQEQNAITKTLARERSDELIAKANVLKGRIAEVSDEQKVLEEKREEFLHMIPNIPFEDVPVGRDESENKVLREVGKRPDFKFEPKDYMALGETLGIIDVKKASEVAGTRFGYLKGGAALLELALTRLAFEVAVKKGFTPVIPPVMIRPDVYENIGRLAADQRDERYFLKEDNLYLVGSAEHTLAPLHMKETLTEASLPRRYVALSTCFRREAGSYGKETKGVLRVHQFDKVEFFSFAHPEKSEEEHLFLLSLQEELMKMLEIPYRVMEICTGDMGWTDARQYDIEAWFPGEGKYRETHSCSNATDFQSRGISTKFSAKGGSASGWDAKNGEKKLVHTLNATAFSQRPILAILENFQTKDGTIKLPKLLREYTGLKEIK